MTSTCSSINFTITNSFIVALRYAPLTSAVATSLCSHASINLDKMNASVLTVGYDDSILDLHNFCFF